MAEMPLHHHLPDGIWQTGRFPWSVRIRMWLINLLAGRDVSVVINVSDGMVHCKPLVSASNADRMTFVLYDAAASVVRRQIIRDDGGATILSFPAR